jgi:hypothetical protein
VICDAHGALLGAETPKQLSDQLASIGLTPGEQLPLVDLTAEGWVLDVDHMTVSPLTFKKSWTKKEVIEVFNGSKTARQAGLEHSAKSLSSKRFDRIMREIVELTSIANNRLKRARKPVGKLLSYGRFYTPHGGME